MHRPFLRTRAPRHRGALVPIALLGIVLSGNTATTYAAASRLVDRVPLREITSTRPGGLMAVYYAGSAGWTPSDQRLTQLLAARGVAVLGIDTAAYPHGMPAVEIQARDLGEMIQVYGDRWRSPKVMVLGVGDSAVGLPAVVNRLEARIRAIVVQVSLVRPEAAPPGSERREAFQQEIGRLGTRGLQCFHDPEQPDDPCRLPELNGSEIVPVDTKGEQGLARRILNGGKRRTVPRRSQSTLR